MKKYKIYMTQGQGGVKVKETKSLQTALKFVRKFKEDGSFAIKCPNGKYYEWEKEFNNV